MKRVSAIILALFMAVGIFAGCAKVEQQTPEVKTAVRVAGLKGPTAMGMVKLMSDSSEKKTANDYAFQIAASVDEITPLLAKGDVDIAAVPANLASVLYNNTKGKVKVLALNTLGVLYIAQTGDSVKTLSDLKGKTIYAAGKGATPEYALRYILKNGGLDPDTDVKIEWKSEHTECVALMAKDPAALALLPEPFLTTAMQKNDKIKVALDLNKLWESGANNGSLITGALVVRTEFADKNKDALKKFMTEYKASVKYVTTETDKAAALVGKYGIVPEAVAKVALPKCNIVCIDGSEMKTKLSGYLKVLFDQNPKAVGGTLPDDNFYYAG